MTKIEIGSKWDFGEITVEVTDLQCDLVHYASVSNPAGFPGAMHSKIFLAAAKPTPEKLKVGQIVRRKASGVTKKWHVRAFDEKDRVILQDVCKNNTPGNFVVISPNPPTTEFYNIIQDVI